VRSVLFFNSLTLIGELMKLLIVVLSLLVTSPSYAQFAFGGGYAGAGLWGGAQACPYASKPSSEQLNTKIEDLQEQLGELQEKLDNMMDGGDDWSDRVKFKDGVAQRLANAIEGRCTDKVKQSESDSASASTPTPTTTVICSTPENPQDICSSQESYTLTSGKEDREFSRYSSNCKFWISRYKFIQKRIAQIEKQIDKLQVQADKAEEREWRAQMRVEDGLSPYTEAGPYCATCGMDPEQPSGLSSKLKTALVVDGITMALGYFGNRYAIRQNQKLGWPTPFYMPGPMATSSVLYAEQLRGMGGGSFGCAPGLGFPFGMNGIYGNPYGMTSPYGMCGGAMMSPCGAGGFNPYMGGGIYPMGTTPYGMSGPWGGGGMFPVPFMGAGLGFGGGFGGPGFGSPYAMMPGMGMPGFGGGFMGNPYGGAYGMMPGMGGGFGGPFGGMPGMGMPGMGGGFGGPFGGMPGMGGGFGGPFGGMPGMGMPGFGFPGMGGYPGFNGLGGAQYQMQMMQMQMQQYQAYYDAQMRSYQNQQMAQQALYSLQIEQQQLQQKYMTIIGYLNGGGMGGMPGMGGGGFGVGIGIGAGIGIGIGGGFGGGGFYTPPYFPPGGGTNPPSTR